MKLLDEIVEVAVDGKQPIVDVLRKCLVLSFQLKNERLKEWVEKELNGYGFDDELPEYRSVLLYSKGTFRGPRGALIRNQPLPLSVLDKKHQELVIRAQFRVPIATFESGSRTDEKANGEKSLSINWSPDLIAMYQDKFFQRYVLVQAWQEVPPGVIVSIIETARNRVLRFALEIKEELGLVSDKVEELPKAKVEQMVTNHIYGGTNIIAGIAHDITQIGNIVVGKGDFESLSEALKKLGLRDPDIRTLKKAMDEDGAASNDIGDKTIAWVQAISKKLTNIGLEVGKTLVTKWLMQYLGLDN